MKKTIALLLTASLLLMASCSSDKKDTSKTASETTVESSSAPSETAELWTCTSCGHEGNSGKFCDECGSAKDQVLPWTCQECGNIGNTNKFCDSCGAPKPDYSSWTCEKCGLPDNTGKFCAECGAPAPKPAEATESTEPVITVIPYVTPAEEVTPGSTNTHIGTMNPIQPVDPETHLKLEVKAHGNIYYDLGETEYGEEMLKAIFLDIFTYRIQNAIEALGYSNLDEIKKCVNEGMAYDLGEKADLKNVVVKVEEITLDDKCKADYEAAIAK